MATKEIINTGFTLTLIAFGLPLFAKDRAIANNPCLYETYLRVDNRCLGISEPGSGSITAQLNADSVKKVNRELAEVSKELDDLSEELDNFCVEQRETSERSEILQDVCQD